MKMSMNSVRRRKDGSIDTEFYVAIGNRERGGLIRAFWARAFRRLEPDVGRVPEDQSVPHRRAAIGY